MSRDDTTTVYFGWWPGTSCKQGLTYC